MNSRRRRSTMLQPGVKCSPANRAPEGHYQMPDKHNLKMITENFQPRLLTCGASTRH